MKRSTQCKLLQQIIHVGFFPIIWLISHYNLINFIFLSFIFFSCWLWCWHFAFMCLPIYSCLYLQQFFTTFFLRHLHLLLIADGIERNIIAWLSSSHVCLISSVWHSMHLLHDYTVMFDTNDGLLLQISFQYLFIVYATKLYIPYIHSLEISDHNYSSASVILVLKQYRYWLLYSPFLLEQLIYLF